MQYRISTATTSEGVRVTIHDRLGRAIYHENSGNESAFEFLKRMQETARAMAHANVKGDVPPHDNHHAKKVAAEVRAGMSPSSGARFSPKAVAEADAEHKRWIRKEMPKAKKRLENLSERVEKLADKISGKAEPQTPTARFKMSEAWREVKPGIFRFRGVSM